jgi:nucleoside-triphosphatase THEP1
MNAHTGHTFEMEAYIQNEEDFLPVGKFIFSKKGFAKAIAIIEKGILEEDGWLVIDEIGPLEINGLGFAEILEKKIPAVFKKINLLIVVRQSLTEEVINHFNLSDKEVTVVEIENSLFQKEF